MFDNEININDLELFYDCCDAQVILTEWILQTEIDSEILLFLEGLEHNFTIMHEILPSGFSSIVDYLKSMNDLTDKESAILTKIERVYEPSNTGTNRQNNGKKATIIK